jgi:AcrR family transcriptional regulator
VAPGRAALPSETRLIAKALIYDYFGNRDQLFDTVFDALVVAIVQDVPIDASDLPEYAGRLFDQYQASPEILRLIVWDILERGGAGARLGVVQATNQNKIAAIEQAQRDGCVSARWSPDELLLLILSISTMWMFVTPEVMERNTSEISARRHTVTEAVRLLVADA